MRRRHPLVLSAAVASALLLSACASPAPAVTATVDSEASAGAAGGSAAPSLTPATACQLLTIEEAQAIVGTTLTAGVEGDPQDPSCSFEPDPKGTRTAQVRVLAGEGAKNTLDVDTASEHTFTDVPGLGDESHQEDYTIFFRKATTWVAITCSVPEDASAVQSQMQDAAKLVASRLP